MRFTDSFRDDLAELMRWRRDVRHFRRTPVPDPVLDACLDSFRTAPSVGLSQPWRLVSVASDAARTAARLNFETANASALAGYNGDKAKTYAALKLSGLDRAPVHWAVYCDETTDQGHGLGTGTMPEMRRYSVACAVMQMWLVARAHGLGLGWVSILDPDQLSAALAVPRDWQLVAYLCLGYPEAEETTPELERKHWEQRHPLPDILSR